MITRLLPLLLCTTLLAAPARAADGTAEAEKRLKTAVGEVLAAADQSRDVPGLIVKLRPILDRCLSFDVMTRRAIGVGWRQFTKPQQDEAVKLFSTLIIRTYSRKFTPGERPEITYKPATTPAPGRVEIPTRLLYQGGRYEVIYRLEQAEGWRITDVVIEGVSLVANYRSQLDAQFKNGGAPAVLAALNKSVSSTP